MRITPLDVRKQEFRKVVRGLDADEVYAFLATVADEYEVVLTDNKQLREKVIELDEKVIEYRNMEKTLRDTLLTAERVMTEARQNARKEAELILRDAQVQANSQTSDIANKVDALRGQLRELRGHRDSFLARLQSLSEAQIGLVASYRRDFENDDYNSQRIERTPESAAPPTESAEPMAENPVEPPAASVQSPEPPVAETPQPAPSRSDDQWRSYSVTEGTTSYEAPRAAESQPAPPVDTRVDDLVPEDRTSASIQEPQAAIEAIDQTVQALQEFDSGPEFYMEEGPEFQAPEVQVPEDYTPPSYDEVHARVFEEQESLEPAAPEYPTDVQAPTPPQAAFSHAAPNEPAPPYPATEPAPEHVNTELPEGENVAGEQGEEGSRWSLSRFTRGLASF